MNLNQPNVRILPVKGDPQSLLELPQKELDELRRAMLRPFRTSLIAPNKAGLYLFRDGSWVVENFSDESVTVELKRHPLKIEARGWAYLWKK